MLSAPTQPPASAMASKLADLLGSSKNTLLYLTTSEQRADDTGEALRCFAPDAEVLVLPPWDCLPYDRASPSRECMGRRLATLRRLQKPRQDRSRIIVAPVEAALQRLPPAAAVDTCWSISTGSRLNREELEAFGRQAGYLLDDRVDEPGELALLGEVVDVFPADAVRPVRLWLSEDEHVTDIRTYDPATQLSIEDLNCLELLPASEVVLPEGVEEARSAGAEHHLSRHYESLTTLFHLTRGSRTVISAEARVRADAILEQIEEAYRSARDFAVNAHPAPPDELYLTPTEWKDALKGAEASPDLAAVSALPAFIREANPRKAFADFVKQQVAEGACCVLAGTAEELSRMERRLKRYRKELIERTDSWKMALGSAAGSVITLEADLGHGFADQAKGLVLVTASDVFGSRLADSHVAPQEVLGTPELKVGDVVVHEDHGAGVLQSLERIEVDGIEHDTMRIEYRGGASLLVPVEEFGKVWRYGADPDAVSLDRLHTDAWLKRRAEVSVEIDMAAAGLVELATERSTATAPIIRPPQAIYNRLASRFPFAETVDQAATIEAILQDLASGHPANRLVCGDVGFGKTEIALRAAAAAALTGHQVAVVAPTTVLARQHLESFGRRFAGTDIKVAHLSRLASKAEAERIKNGLADGSVRIVIATHAIASSGVRFDDLGLVILDEEQRFGARFKQQIHEIAPTAHFVMLSATPIPRTLLGALAGIQDVSILSTPPARRRPVRTFVCPFDRATAKTALMREHRRGGQSFLVVPRISDIEKMRRQLAELVPDLTVLVAHGEMAVDEIDNNMVSFASGGADVLLATNIIESGLDVPRANTMLVWRPDRFGLSQLHQLRGRVGRGRVQAVTYLFSDPAEDLSAAAQARLETLVAYDRLGAGLEISMRDLDQRGGGDLLGDEQSGHSKLLGQGLYQQLMSRALRTAQGEELGPQWPVQTHLGLSGAIPHDYVPEANVRIGLYARVQRAESVKELQQFNEELEDRFGAPPREVVRLLKLRAIAIRARRLGIEKIDGGPFGIAFTFRKTPGQALLDEWLKLQPVSQKGDRILVEAPTKDGAQRLALARKYLQLFAKSPAERPPPLPQHASKGRKQARAET
jgi:transcription-repair coupling factor (superfamily II helicase)